MDRLCNIAETIIELVIMLIMAVIMVPVRILQRVFNLTAEKSGYKVQEKSN